MAYHHEWSQSYMKDYQLTFEEHHLNNDELMIEEETELSSNLYLKLRNISKACTCKEDVK